MTYKLYFILAEINLDKGGRHMEIEGKEDRSVFVSNLDFAVTELDVKDALSSIGHCEVLLVRDFKGRSKGFGYVLFEKPVSMRNMTIIIDFICNLILFVGNGFRSIEKRS